MSEQPDNRLLLPLRIRLLEHQLERCVTHMHKLRAEPPDGWADQNQGAKLTKQAANDMRVEAQKAAREFREATENREIKHLHAVIAHLEDVKVSSGEMELARK